MRLRIQSIQSDGNTVKLEGHLDRETVPRIRGKLLGLAGKKAKGEICFDLSGIVQMDTAGVALLVEALRRLSHQGVQLHLSGLSERVRQLIHLARLEQLFNIEDGQQNA